MKTYAIQITMPNGWQGSCYGTYSDGFDAVIQAMTTFPEACRITARRLA